MKKIIFTATIFAISTIASAQSWKPIFGEKLTEAEYDATVWSEKEGVLTATKDEAIWTKTEYENFELDLEFKNDVGTNSGVVIYSTDKKNWIPNSVEIQINDDWKDEKKEVNNWKCGAIFGHLAPTKVNVVNKPGEWNRMIITAKGKNIKVKLNGEEVTDMDMSKWTSGTVNPDGTKIPAWLPKPYAEIPTKGFIGFQGKHGESFIWFRNIKIRQL